MRVIATALGLAMVSGLAFVSPAEAGGRTYSGHDAPAGCYQQHTYPAQYRTVAVRELVHPATTRAVHVPAQYGHVTRRVETHPQWVETINVPAEYRTVHERQLVSPAHYTWERRMIHGRETMCKIHIPAEYSNVTRQVLVTPASTRTRVHPAQYHNVRERIVTREATVRHEHVPAVYRTVHRRELVSAERTVWRSVRSRHSRHCRY